MKSHRQPKPFEPGMEQAASELVMRVFNIFEAPDYPAEGIAEFTNWARSDSILERFLSGRTFGFCCYDDNRMIGFIEVRDGSHISLLFVEPDEHRRGIARSLYQAALLHAAALNSSLRVVTVNSSPYAVGFYAQQGFAASGPEQMMNGIRFIPMTLEILNVTD